MVKSVSISRCSAWLMRRPWMYWVTLHPNCRLKQLFSLLSLMQAMLASRSRGMSKA